MHFYLGLGGVAQSRQCSKMNFLKAKILRFISDFGVFYCASYTCWHADIHTAFSLCTDVFKYTQLLHMFSFYVGVRVVQNVAAITHEYVIAVERIQE